MLIHCDLFDPGDSTVGEEGQVIESEEIAHDPGWRVRDAQPRVLSLQQTLERRVEGVAVELKGRGEITRDVKDLVRVLSRRETNFKHQVLMSAGGWDRLSGLLKAVNR